MNWHTRDNVKLLAAMIGGSAVLAIGALTTMAVHRQEVGPDTVVAKSSMKVGDTTTATTPPKVEATTMAVPAIKGPAPLPSEEQGLPG